MKQRQLGMKPNKTDGNELSGNEEALQTLVLTDTPAGSAQQLIKKNKARTLFFKQELDDRSEMARYARHFEAIIESSDDAIISKTLDGIITSWNRSAERIFGYTAAEMLGKPMLILFPEDRVNEESSILEKIKRGEKVDHIRTIRLHKNGSMVHLSVTISPIFNSFGVVIGASKIARDISEQILAEKNALRLAAYARHFEAIVESSEDAIISKTMDGIVTSWNKSAEKIFGYTAEEIIGSSLLRLFPENRRQEESLIMDKLKRGEKVEHFRTVRVDKSGNQVHISVTMSPIINEFGIVTGASKIARDITARINSEKLIWHQANYDNLTGLPNRRLLSDRLTQEIDQALRDKSSIAVMFIDLDHFKDVNDSVGHDAGDELLVLASQRFRHLIRRSDTVSRFGGDEFVIMLTDVTDVIDVENIAAKMVVDLQQPFLINDREVFISISLGVAVYPNDGKTVDDLLKHADQAMYEAKKSGRNQQKFFNTDMTSSIEQHMQLVTDLREAQALDQLALFFQPIVNLATGGVSKAESLIRWHHPLRGLVSPIEFIPLAEETGLIHPIGEWVFETAIAQLKQWQTCYGDDFQLSINKSPLQFHAQDGAEVLWVDKMRDLGVCGRSLVVEITENSLMNYSGVSIEKLFSFKNSGIQIALDDFGTGYSSLSYLNKFDIDYLKIDKTFVRNLTALSNEYLLCESIVIMAHKLGIKVIAEGVETEEQR
jgi:diguanylate cyclase (GGDEF)-like protein/PAS domain S-box-containing protein